MLLAVEPAIDIVSTIANTGIVGIMFVMWYQERADRLKSTNFANQLSTLMERSVEREKALVAVIGDSTEASTKLATVIDQLQRTLERK